VGVGPAQPEGEAEQAQNQPVTPGDFGARRCSAGPRGSKPASGPSGGLPAVQPL